MRRVGDWLFLPFRLLWGVSKGVFLAAALALLALNVATVTLSGVFAAVSGAVSAVSGIGTVKQRHEGRVAALSSHNRQLLREVEATRVRYRGERVAARAAVSDTSRRIGRRVAIATSRNVASMAGEALPFVGIAVIVGATAWELKESCEMMRDLRELDAAFNPDRPISEDAVCGMEVPTREEIGSRIVQGPGAVWREMQEMYAGLPGLGDGYERLLGWGGSWFGGEGGEAAPE